MVNSNETAPQTFAKPARLRKDGTPRSPRSGSDRRRNNDQMNIRIPRVEHEAIEILAEAAGISAAEWVRRKALADVFCYLPGPGSPVAQNHQILEGLAVRIDRMRDDVLSISKRMDRGVKASGRERKAARIKAGNPLALAVVEAQLTALTAEVVALRHAVVAVLGRVEEE